MNSAGPAQERRPTLVARRLGGLASAAALIDPVKALLRCGSCLGAMAA